MYTALWHLFFSHYHVQSVFFLNITQVSNCSNFCESKKNTRYSILRAQVLEAKVELTDLVLHLDESLLQSGDPVSVASRISAAGLKNTRAEKR